MLQRAATNGREISREDFYNIMTKKAFWLALFMIRYIQIYTKILNKSTPILQLKDRLYRGNKDI
jgi:hypothetical protein